MTALQTATVTQKAAASTDGNGLMTTPQAAASPTSTATALQMVAALTASPDANSHAEGSGLANGPMATASDNPGTNRQAEAEVNEVQME